MASILDEIQIGSFEDDSELIRKKEEIDFKFVTFTLAGRYYAIDIMTVKEICKALNFTYVPNTASYVEGVYNLRGEIITIINLRKMFHLPIRERKENELANILILNISGSIIGLIVDTIENILGVSAKAIQPRHQLFTDIQIKYISGVIDSNSKLYIILDVERILGEDSEKQEEPTEKDEALVEKDRKKDFSQSKEDKPKAKKIETTQIIKSAQSSGEVDFQFIAETLATFAGFYVDSLNQDWVKARLSEWKKICEKQKRDFQLKSLQDALNFLEPFYSPYTGSIWGEDLKKELESIFAAYDSSALKVWNPGTGKGTEAYSVCAILKLLFPKTRLKVWACDNNLLAISNAPLLIFSRDMMPSYLLKSGLVSEEANGFQFSTDLKDLILFEYHDLNNPSTLPELDLIVARDVISFFPKTQKEKLLNDFAEKLKDGGILIVGTNERVLHKSFSLLAEGNLVAYKKEKS